MAEPKESRVVLPKVKRPPGRPPKHGAFSGAELALIIPSKKSEIIEILEGNKVAIGPADMPVVNLLAKNMAIIELILRFFSSCGLFDEDSKMRQGDMKVYLAAVNATARLCDMMRMTPQSRVRLGIGMIQATKDLASMMSEAEDGEPK